jgi:hypothetical protein
MVDIVESDIGLSYQPASLCSMGGRYDNPPMPESTLSPPSGTMNLATGSRNIQHSAKPAKIVICKNQKTPEAILNQNPEMCILQYISGIPVYILYFMNMGKVRLLLIFLFSSVTSFYNT